MQMKQFHLGDVLSIITGRIVSPRHIDGVSDILNFMTGENLFTYQIPKAVDKCRFYLIKQFPQLNTTKMDFAVAELDQMLKTVSEDENLAKKKLIIAGWLAEQDAKYGEMFTVKSIPGAIPAAKDLVAEDGTILNIEKVKTFL